MLKLIDIHTYYGETHVLWGISLKIEKSDAVAILGRNGMGKTTILHSIIGFTPPRRGRIIIKGKDVTNLESYQIAQTGVAIVPQGRRIFPSLSVRDNLIIGIRGKGYDLDKISALFPVLKIRANNMGNQLSGGEQQMLAIARAMLANPDLILMDEPSEGLAPAVIETIGEIIVKLKEGGNLSFLLVEQNVPLALRVSDYCYLLNNGKIAHQCSKAELVENENIQEKYIGVSHYAGG